MGAKRLGLLATGLLAHSTAAQAALVTFDFTVSGEPGAPLGGETATGFFTFDDSIIPAGGGDADGTNLLLDFELTWNGVTYDETTANTGYLEFRANGTIADGVFGTECTPGGCSAGHETHDWLVSLGNPGREFTYAIGAERLFFGTVTFTRRDVSEPATLALLGCGLLGFAWARRRKAS